VQQSSQSSGPITHFIVLQSTGASLCVVSGAPTGSATITSFTKKEKKTI